MIKLLKVCGNWLGRSIGGGFGIKTHSIRTPWEGAWIFLLIGWGTGAIGSSLNTPENHLENKKNLRTSGTQAPALVQWVIESPKDGPGSEMGPQISPGIPRLRLRLTTLLSPKQMTILQGGFTTLSQLVIQWPQGGGGKGDFDLGEATSQSEQIPILKERRCSVKFDAWEESFEVIRFGETQHQGDKPSDPVALLAKTIEEYGDQCLSSELDLSQIAPFFSKFGGQLLVTLIVKQTSLDETAKIKDWLIQQQSGVIQGLFSHMLGDLTLHQVVRTVLDVPPYSRPKMGEFRK